MPEGPTNIVNAVTGGEKTISNLKWLSYGVLGILIALGVGIGTWFFISHNKKDVQNHGATVVHDIEANSAEDAANVAQEKIVEHYTYYNTVDKEVEHDMQEVNNAGDATTVMDPDIDAAGRAALCRLRDGGCARTEAAPLLNGSGPVPKSDKPLRPTD